MESILFVGNSYTYYNDLPKLFEALARENRREIRVDSVTKGARKLSEFRKSEDPYTEKLAALLCAHHYAATFLQEQSILPLNGEATFLLGVRHLCEMLDGKSDRVILYQTWARKAGHKTLVQNGWTVDGMACGLRDAYRRVADAVGGEISPVGEAFAAFVAKTPSLELYAEDGTHPSRLGSALAAVVHYRCVFRTMPDTYTSLTLSENELDAVLYAAGEVYKK